MKDVSFLCGLLKRVFQFLFVLAPAKLIFFYGLALLGTTTQSPDARAIVVNWGFTWGLEVKDIPFNAVSGAWLHFAIDLIPTVTLMALYYMVAKIFYLYQQNKIFSAEVTHTYRKVAGILFIYFVSQLIVLLLHSAFSSQFAEKSSFNINLNQIDLLDLLFAGTAYVMAKISDESKSMADLNAYTI